MTTDNLHFKTPVYEGPLELLLDLIEKRKLLINDISLASVADEYIARVNSMAELPVGETAQFVSLAATLLLIKSRSLLPTLELSGEEERDIKELEYRLAVYQIIKDASRGLRQSFASPMLYEGTAQPIAPMFLPDESVTVEALRGAAQTLIQGFPQLARLPHVEVKKIMSLEDMIGDLSRRISSAMRLSFREFTGKREKGEIIVSFLALLELVKQGIIRASQEKEFGDIQLQSDKVSTPSYE